MFIINSKASANAHQDNNKTIARALYGIVLFLKGIKRNKRAQSASIYCLSFRLDKNFADF